MLDPIVTANQKCHLCRNEESQLTRGTLDWFLLRFNLDLNDAKPALD